MCSLSMRFQAVHPTLLFPEKEMQRNKEKVEEKEGYILGTEIQLNMVRQMQYIFHSQDARCHMSQTKRCECCGPSHPTRLTTGSLLLDDPWSGDLLYIVVDPPGLSPWLGTHHPLMCACITRRPSGGDVTPRVAPKNDETSASRVHPDTSMQPHRHSLSSIYLILPAFVNFVVNLPRV